MRILLTLILLLGSVPALQAASPSSSQPNTNNAYQTQDRFYGKYDNLTLDRLIIVPSNIGSGDGTDCSSFGAGNFYTDTTSGEVYTCLSNGVGGYSWTSSLSERWKEDGGLGQTIYPIDIDNPTDPYSLGIGTQQPLADIHIKIARDAATNPSSTKPSDYTSLRLEQTNGDHAAYEFRA